ncbi:MAG: lipoyl(octanoyl) transferase LipB [Bacteroidales bacterium]
MAAEIKFEDLGQIEYAEAWKYQEFCQQQVINSKNTPGSLDYSTVLFCEHPHVYTLGRSGQQENLLINPEFLKSIGASFFKTDRGGDITYHGPGQLVGYPIIDLNLFGIGVKTYIGNLEESVIETLKDFRITSSRLPGSTGVWIDAEKKGFSRKICAIGVKISRYVTMHGFALNVNTNLKYFSYINPCGFVDKGVTSMEQELGKIADIEEVKKRFRYHFNRLFKIKNP